MKYFSVILCAPIASVV